MGALTLRGAIVENTFLSQLLRLTEDFEQPVIEMGSRTGCGNFRSR